MKPQHLTRYRDIARLFFKYGRKDLIQNAGLDEIDLEMDDDEVEGAGIDGESPTAHAEELARDLEALGPTFIKAGQFLSTRADLLPAPYLDALARLQDQVEPFSFAEVEKIVTEELGVRMSKAFAFFDDRPLAAASLGQVHRAELRDGRPVAVKVQRPGIRDQILEDLEALTELAGFLDRHTEVGERYGVEPMVEQFRRSLLRELDYQQEARNLTMLSENLAEFERLVVPDPVEDFVTSRVLTMEFIRGRKVTSLGPLARIELDGAPLADELSRAYLQQILVDGVFHADPHPGNILLTDDGRVALLDLGMVAFVGPTMRQSLLKLLLAVSEGNGDEAAAVAIRLGEKLPGYDDREVRRSIAEIVMRTEGREIQDIQVGRLVFEVARRAAAGGVRMPRELTLLGKTLLNVDQVTRGLDPHFDPNASIRRHVVEIMHQNMKKDLSPGKMFAGLLEMKEFVEKLPGRLNSVIDAVSENRLRLRVDAFDEVLLIEGMQKIANRITMGLVISAMIVGAAMLMRVETTFRILGYPGLAVIFFVAAAVCGLLLVGNILVNDLRSSKRRVRERAAERRGPGSGG